MSEIVVPLIVSGRVTGVLDVDSPEPARFGEEERQLMEAIATLYNQSSEA
jgi:GAF domain-containing protein